jgi:hypothetical protein
MIVYDDVARCLCKFKQSVNDGMQYHEIESSRVWLLTMICKVDGQLIDLISECTNIRKSYIQTYIHMHM